LIRPAKPGHELPTQPNGALRRTFAAPAGWAWALSVYQARLVNLHVQWGATRWTCRFPVERDRNRSGVRRKARRTPATRAPTTQHV